MSKSRWIVIFLVVLLLAFISFIFALNQQKNTIQQASLINKAVSKVFPNQDYIAYDKNDFVYDFIFYLDPSIITTPLDIKDKRGNILAVAKITFKALYLDRENKPRSVLIPRLIEFSDGTAFVPFGHLIRQKEEIQKVYEELVLMYKDKKERLMKADIVLDTPKAWLIRKNIQGLPHQDALLERYQTSWSEELQNFLENGNDEIKIVLAFALTDLGFASPPAN